MTDFNIKMINHAGIASDRRGEIEVALRAIFDEAFDASSDSVFVGWGAGHTKISRRTRSRRSVAMGNHRRRPS